MSQERYGLPRQREFLDTEKEHAAYMEELDRAREDERDRMEDQE